MSTAQGSTAGGSVVSLNGFGFTGATGVSYGGVPALAFSVINDGTIRTVTPPGTAGAVDIEVAIAGGPYVRSNGFTYVSPQSPAITRFSPTIGSTAGGTSVVITGQNFTGATGVTFAGVAATSFTVDSATQITAITPAGTNGTAAIAVTTPIGTASSGSSSFFYQAPPVSAPSITNVTPSSGSSAGGSTVTILGTNLVGSTSVTFGGTPATSFSLVSPNSLSAIAPAGTVGTVDVVVTTPLGSATRANAFTYTATAAPQITSFTPNNGPITGGTTVTITGAGFTGATAVRFIGVTASSFTVDSDTQITAVTAAPPGFASSTVQVVTPNGTAISSRLFTYTASSISPPAVVSLSPASGLPAGGNSVTITGTNFSGANEVRFGNTLASSYVVDSPTQITAIAPAGSVGAVAVSVTTLGGSVSSSNAYTYASSQQQLTSQTISFTSTAPGSAVVGGATYTPTATATSGLAVAFTIDSSSSAICAISGGVVSFTGAGTCSVNADQAGDSSFSAAPRVQQSFSVSAAAPTISAISPNSGSTAGGTSVVITGTNLTGATSVNFGSVAASSFTVNSATQITAVAPAGSAGSVSLSVTTAGGTATSTGAFTYTVPAPVVSSVSPNVGTVWGSSTITITGSGFTGATAVTFGTTPASSFTVISDTQISAQRPQAPAGQVSVSVTGPTGTGTLPNAFTFFVAPQIDTISPAFGPVAGGTTVTISGQYFTGATSVYFGSSPAQSYTVNSDTQITAVSPAGSSGSVDIQISLQSSSSSRPNMFTYGAPNIVLTPMTFAPAIVGQAYSEALAASGAVAPYSFAVTAGALPAGLSLSANGTISGTPTAGGTFNFTVTATDASTGAGAPFAGSRAYTLTVGIPVITITPSGALPAGTMGQAYAQTLTASGGTAPYAFAVNAGTLPAGLTLTTGGVLSGTPTQAGNFSFTIAATDSSTGTGPFVFVEAYSVSIAQNAPVLSNVSGVAVPYGSSGMAIDLTPSIAGASTSIAIATAPAHGTTTITGNVVTYTPTAGYYGADSFTYTATGPGGTSAPATVSLTVATPTVPSVTARSGVAVPYASSGTAIDLTASVSGVYSSIAVATAPARGSVSISGNVVTYTPTAGYFGADSFAFTATGPGGTSAPATVSLTVATPAAPSVTARSGVAVPYASSGTAIDLTSSVSGVYSSIAIATAPTRGTVSVSGNVVTYTPTSGSFGADSFTFTATGPGGTSAPATVSLTIATPAVPVVTARSGIAVPFNSQGAVIDLSTAISGVSNSITIATPPANGTATVVGNVVTYRPRADYYGADSFAFTATGPGGTSAPATVTLNVAGGAPRVQPQSGSTSDGQMVSIELTRGAAVGPFTAAQIVSVSPANAVTTRVTSTGDGAARRFFLEATAAPRFGGTVQITYTLANAFGVSPVGTVTLTVAARPDPARDPRVRALSDAQIQATRRFGRSQIDNFMRRNEQLHDGRSRSSQNISVNIVDPARERRPEDMMAASSMSARDSTPVAESTPTPDAAPSAPQEKSTDILGAMSVWVSGAIDIATRDATTFAPKLSATTSGISGGVDFRLNKRTAIGFGGGYGNMTSDIDGKAAQLDARSNLVAVYGSTKLFDNGFIDIVAGRGELDYKTRRRIDGTDLTALGTRTGTMNLGAVSLGFKKQVETLDWAFYSSFEYLDAKLASYVETGGGARNNLRLSAIDDTSYSAGLGFRLKRSFKTGVGLVTPRLNAEWGREFGKANIQYVDYSDITDAAARSINFRETNQDYYKTSLGAMIDLKNEWSFDLEYALMYNSAMLSSGIKVQVSKAF